MQVASDNFLCKLDETSMLRNCGFAVILSWEEIYSIYNLRQGRGWTNKRAPVEILYLRTRDA